jgi:hypothetical protein
MSLGDCSGPELQANIYSYKAESELTVLQDEPEQVVLHFGNTRPSRPER